MWNSMSTALLYATHFIASFFLFFAQSKRYRSINFWYGSPVSSASPLKYSRTFALKLMPTAFFLPA